MRNKRGFTLTEVLVALAIIGIVSAMTIPQLVNSTQKKQNGATIARTVNLFETGCQKVISDYNKDPVNGIQIDKILLIPNWKSEVLANIGATQKGSYQKYKFNNLKSEFNMGDYVLMDLQKTYSATPAFSAEIDANGFDQGPNSAGIDQFNFNIDNSCHIIPADNNAKNLMKNGFKIK